MGFTHLDDHGRARMVDVSAKEVTYRRAVARCVVTTHVTVPPDSWAVSCAKVAGIQAAKRTSDLIPLCHPLSIDATTIEVVPQVSSIEIKATTEVWAKTGVEMEALTACATAGLSLVVSVLDEDPEASIGELAVEHKSGGKSGSWDRVVGPTGIVHIERSRE